jgi:hypothetical protein
MSSKCRKGLQGGLIWAALLALSSGSAAAQAQLLPAPGANAAALGANPAQGDALRCLTLAVAYEAGNQPRIGQEAVAEVVLNRLAHPAFPKSVCGVVWQGWRRGSGCQFTFVCDGALQQRLADRTVMAARQVAQAALTGQAPRRVEGALNYHADYVQPAWAAALGRVAQIGAHVFYRPRSGGRAEGADQTAVWDEPDHDVIARAYARYRAVDDGPALAPLRLPPPEAPPERQVFAPWGLAIVK